VRSCGLGSVLLGVGVGLGVTSLIIVGVGASVRGRRDLIGWQVPLVGLSESRVPACYAG
jgi:hypothetical protein